MLSIEMLGLERMIRAIDAMEAELRIQEEELPKQCAIQLSLDIVANIANQSFAGTYPEYGPKYAEKKRKAVGHLRFWELYGDLIGSISAFPGVGGGWEAGIVSGSMNREGKAVAWYAGLNEGKRPLFGPSRDKFVAGTWRVLGMKSLAKVGARWGGK